MVNLSPFTTRMDECLVSFVEQGTPRRDWIVADINSKICYQRWLNRKRTVQILRPQKKKELIALNQGAPKQSQDLDYRILMIIERETPSRRGAHVQLDIDKRLVSFVEAGIPQKDWKIDHLGREVLRQRWIRKVAQVRRLGEDKKTELISSNQTLPRDSQDVRYRILMSQDVKLSTDRTAWRRCDLQVLLACEIDGVELANLAMFVFNNSIGAVKSQLQRMKHERRCRYKVYEEETFLRYTTKEHIQLSHQQPGKWWKLLKTICAKESKWTRNSNKSIDGIRLFEPNCTSPEWFELSDKHQLPIPKLVKEWISLRRAKSNSNSGGASEEFRPIVDFEEENEAAPIEDFGEGMDGNSPIVDFGGGINESAYIEDFGEGKNGNSPIVDFGGGMNEGAHIEDFDEGEEREVDGAWLDDQSLWSSFLGGVGAGEGCVEFTALHSK